MEIVMALVLEEVKALGAQNVFLGGSERGVSIALATYLYFNERDHGGPLGGVFGFAGIFNKEVENWTQFNMEEKKKTPVFLYHGEDDVFINPRHAVSTYNHLIKKGLTQIKFKCDGKLNYELTSGCTRELSQFLSETLKPRKPQAVYAQCLNAGLGLVDMLTGESLLHDARKPANFDSPIDESEIYRVEH